MEIFKILVFFLAFSSLLSALTASRNLKQISSENKAPQEFQDEVLMDLSEQSGGVLDEKIELIFQGRGRMDIETNDYSGTGANTHHDPKPPGTNG